MFRFLRPSFVRSSNSCFLSMTAATRNTEELVTVERRGAVAIVTLNNPKALNALTAPMGEKFVDVVKDLSEGDGSDGLGAVVLTGAGRAFSAGGDLQFLRDRAADTPSRNAVIMRRFYERFLSVRRIPVPVIAAINGPAIGAGLCLALACDVRVAAASAPMGITFVGLGLHPGMGATHFLPRIVGPQIASRLILTGDVVKGDEAAKLGMVAECCETPEETVEAAVALATRMASQGPLAVRTAVRSLRLGQDDGLDRALWREADAQAEVWNSSDLTEGLDALVERRTPEFSNYETLTE